MCSPVLLFVQEHPTRPRSTATRPVNHGASLSPMLSRCALLLLERKMAYAIAMHALKDWGRVKVSQLGYGRTRGTRQSKPGPAIRLIRTCVRMMLRRPACFVLHARRDPNPISYRDVPA